MTVANPPATRGAINQEATIAKIPYPLFHPQFGPSHPKAAIPPPVIAPTIQCVVETGKPMYVANISHVELAIRAHTIININTYGSSLNSAIGTTISLPTLSRVSGDTDVVF